MNALAGLLDLQLDVDELGTVVQQGLDVSSSEVGLDAPSEQVAALRAASPRSRVGVDDLAAFIDGDNAFLDGIDQSRSADSSRQ